MPGTEALQGLRELHAAELVAVVGEHPLELPAGCLELASDALGEL
jgi:hypothetical protein